MGVCDCYKGSLQRPLIQYGSPFKRSFLYVVGRMRIILREEITLEKNHKKLPKYLTETQTLMYRDIHT